MHSSATHVPPPCHEQPAGAYGEAIGRASTVVDHPRPRGDRLNGGATPSPADPRRNPSAPGQHLRAVARRWITIEQHTRWSTPDPRISAAPSHFQMWRGLQREPEIESVGLEVLQRNQRHVELPRQGPASPTLASARAFWVVSTGA